MKEWKVILAALVIFAAGVVTGGLTVQLKLRNLPQTSAPANLGPLRPKGDLLDRMQRQLYLTPVQRQKIEVILRDSHERMKQLWESIAPQAQEEHRRVHELIRAQLTPEQQKKYEEMLKARTSSRSKDERRRRDESREERRDPKASRKSETPTPAAPLRERP